MFGGKGTIAVKLYKKGSIISIPGFFDNDPSKIKYCLLMEDCENERNTIIVILSSSKLKYKNKPWVVFIPNGTIPELPLKDGIFDCNNYHDINKEKLLKLKCKFICYIPESIMQQIYSALTFAYKIKPDEMLRIKPNN